MMGGFEIVAILPLLKTPKNGYSTGGAPSPAIELSFSFSRFGSSPEQTACLLQ